MFTGIIEARGFIEKIKPLSKKEKGGHRLYIKTKQLPLKKVSIGDSIAINGACMTVVKKSKNKFCVDVSAESLSKTVGLNQLGQVNLERALALGDVLGGHLVTGHVDGVGQVVAYNPVAESMELVIRLPSSFNCYLAYKGSVAINGISLTVNQVKEVKDGVDISINLIPHTIKKTTFLYTKTGDLVNVEIDLIARYAKKMLSLK